MIGRLLAYLPATVIPITINFGLAIIYAKNLTPGEFGTYSIYNTTALVIYAGTLATLQTAAFRFYSMKGGYRDASEYWSTYIFANLGIGLFVALVLLVCGITFGFSWAPISFAVCVSGPYQFLLNMFRLRDLRTAFTVGRVSASVGALLLIAIVIGSSADVTFEAPIYTFYGAYMFVVVGGLAWGATRLSPRSVSLSLLRRSFIYGFPMSLSNVLVLVIPYAAQFILLIHLSKADVGAYSLGFRLSDATIANVTMIVLTVLTPALMRRYDYGSASGLESTGPLLTRMINLTAWIIAPLCVAFAVYSKPMVSLLFPDYVGMSQVVMWIVFASALRSVSMITSKGLELSGATGRILTFLAIAVAVNIAYMLAFVPVYGIVAAGHASLLAFLVYNVLLVAASTSFTPIKVDWPYLARVFSLSVIMGVAGALLLAAVPAFDLRVLLLEMCLSMIVYLSLSILFGMLGGFSEAV